ncbi:MAG: methyltransferase domain-containing protein [Desulfohalobiaceae bacterium]
MDPARYDAWYDTRKGAWILRRETGLLLDLLRPIPGMSLLDVGSGTGRFTREFADSGLRVTGLEPDPDMLRFARSKHPDIPFLRGDALNLPFREQSFDLVAAVTSLCFVSDPEASLGQMWRVARIGIVAGLLNRRSLLYRRKAGRGGYAGARWDTPEAARKWGAGLDPPISAVRWGSTVLLPGGSALARLLDPLPARRNPWGSFLAVCWLKSLRSFHFDSQVMKNRNPSHDVTR